MKKKKKKRRRRTKKKKRKKKRKRKRRRSAQESGEARVVLGVTCGGPRELGAAVGARGPPMPVVPAPRRAV
eukprot:3321097-Rhodomonas_salina.1